MQKDLIFREKDPQEHFGRVLEQTLKEGAQRLLQQAIENEVQEYLDGYRDMKTEDGRRSVVRNGYLPERSVLTGIGPISLKQPRVRDKEKKRPFASAILPPYMRRKRKRAFPNKHCAPQRKLGG